MAASFLPATKAKPAILQLARAPGLPGIMGCIKLTAAGGARLGLGLLKKVVVDLTKALEKSRVGK